MPDGWDGRRFYQRARGFPGGAYAAHVRTVLSAEILSVGSELTVGETRDTNAGDLARDLTARGVAVRRMTALPDELPAVRDAFSAALERSDLVVSTGGLGPTPDDLTREAIAAAVGEVPAVDRALERWLRGLFERRGMGFAEANLKQAWLIPSAMGIPNEHGTAPGWWVDRPDGRIAVALPGPPREMRPMWSGWVVPRLAERGLGRETAVVTLRTTGIGESSLVDLLRPWLEATEEPVAATYARADAVDVRIWGGDPAAVEDAERRIRAILVDKVWATGDTTWPAALAAALTKRDWRLATVEIGTRGSLTALLGEGLGEALGGAELLAGRPTSPGTGGRRRIRLETIVAAAQDRWGAEVGLAVEATPRGGDTGVSVVVRTPDGSHSERRLVFLGGPQGRARAAVTAASILLRHLGG